VSGHPAGAPSVHDACWEDLVLRSSLPRLEARILLAHASGRSREWLVAHGDEAADVDATRAFTELARRRQAGEPIAYLTGTREFYGRAFKVSPRVLIPRPETELLVRQALARAGSGARVLDLGTGSGAIAVSLACERADLRITATDRDDQALAVARRNAQRLAAEAVAGGRLQWRAGHWWAAVDAADAYDVVISNPPYVATGDPHLDRGDLRHEPRAALAAGADGLEALREIVAGAPSHLRPGGWLLLEHGHEQGDAVRALLEAAGFVETGTLCDAAGLPRVTIARKVE